jgi:hypothetical protein
MGWTADTISVLLMLSLGTNCILAMMLIRTIALRASKYRAAACRKCGYDTRATIDGKMSGVRRARPHEVANAADHDLQLLWTFQS